MCILLSCGELCLGWVLCMQVICRRWRHVCVTSRCTSLVSGVCLGCLVRRSCVVCSTIGVARAVYMPHVVLHIARIAERERLSVYGLLYRLNLMKVSSPRGFVARRGPDRGSVLGWARVSNGCHRKFRGYNFEPCVTNFDKISFFLCAPAMANFVDFTPLRNLFRERRSTEPHNRYLSDLFWDDMLDTAPWMREA